ncbi:MAG: hypothetical protein ACXV1K_07325 [Kineosporiaceae bacterium]
MLPYASEPRAPELLAARHASPPHCWLVGGALYLAQGVATAFGSGWGLLMAPLALQEIALAIWLIVKGFAEDVAENVDHEPRVKVSA